MSEFHDPFPNYEMMAHHDEAHGKKIRRKLWNVFWLLLVVTITEIFIGIKAAEWGFSANVLKFIFIGLTVFKAYFIVYTFMHLGEETRWTKWVIIAPFAGFILYLIIMLTIGEGEYSKTRRIDEPIPNEKVKMMEEARHSGHHEAAGETK